MYRVNTNFSLQQTILITHSLLLISDCYLYCATHSCLLLPCLSVMASTVEYLPTMKSSTQQMNYNSIMKLNKDIIAKCLEGCVKLFEIDIKACKSAALEIDKLKTKVIQIQSVRETVQNEIGSVQETVKTEMCRWAKIVEKSCEQTEKLLAKSVEQAVMNVTEEEEI